MPKEKPLFGFQSTMESHPDYVFAIGMITIELGNLEMELADLLGAILNCHKDVAHAIYFTPRAVIPRVDVLVNVSESTLNQDLPVCKRLRSVAGRAKAVMGKRNTLLHAVWGTREKEGGVHRCELPMKEGALVPVRIKELYQTVDDIRELIAKINGLQDEVSALHVLTASPEESS